MHSSGHRPASLASSRMRTQRLLALALAALLALGWPLDGALAKHTASSPSHAIRLSRHRHHELPRKPVALHPALILGAPAALRAAHLASLPAAGLDQQRPPPVQRTIQLDVAAFDDIIDQHAEERLAGAGSLSSKSPARRLLGAHHSPSASPPSSSPAPSLHPALASLNSTGSSSSRLVTIRLTDFHSVMYTGRIGVGTPRQGFEVIFDTGSSCLWVMAAPPLGRTDRSERARKFVHYYVASLSSTHESSLGADSDWAISYGVGECKGTLANDTLELGGLVAAHQTFAAVERVSGNFLNKRQPMDGILGLSFPSGACAHFPTALMNLHGAGVLPQRVFSFVLDSAPRGDVDLSGGGVRDRSVLVLGAPSPEEQASLAWTKVLRGKHKQPSMWFVKLQALRVGAGAGWGSTGGAGLTLCSSASTAPCAALPDSGTSFLTAPSALFSSLINAITSGRSDCMMDGESNVFCLDGPAGLPPLTFTFEGRDFVLEGRDYLLPNAQLAIQLMDFDVPGVDIVILGDMFLRRVSTVFDMDATRVGFGNARELNLTPTKTAIVLGALAFTVMLLTCLGVNYFIRSKQQGEYEQIREVRAATAPVRLGVY